MRRGGRRRRPAKLIAGNVALGVGVVALGVAGWLFFTRATNGPVATRDALVRAGLGSIHARF